MAIMAVAAISKIIRVGAISTTATNSKMDTNVSLIH